MLNLRHEKGKKEKKAVRNTNNLRNFFRLSCSLWCVLIFGTFFLMSSLGSAIMAQESVQPELSEEGFINLINSILDEKVSLDMFDKSYGYYVYIRNTIDNNGKQIYIRVGRYMTEIHISVNPGHFSGIPQPPQSMPPMTETPVTLEEIDTRSLFTHEVESQVDLTPPSDFVATRIYDIVVMGYRGKLDVSRGNVSIYFKNIGALSPSPIPKPTINASKASYYALLTAASALVLTIVGVIVLKRRKIT